MSRVDVLVVGAGPAGAVAARALKDRAPNLDVMLVERDRAVGAPVRCAEGVGDAGLREFATPEGSDWYLRRITRVIFLAPDGTEVKVAERDVGWVLDRTRFDAYLAAEAGRAGADVRVGTEVTGLTRTGDAWDASLDTPHGPATVRARIVIAADGVESMVGRWAGIDTRVRARDMESCAQYVVHNIEFDPDAIYLHFGDAVAPGGYAWVFPRGVGVANVGLGVVSLRANGKSAREWLDAYLAARFPHGVTVGYTVGGVIVGTTIRKPFGDGILVAGDSAHMINPLSGGGIVNAMKAGRLAAEVAVAALARGDTSETALAPYHARWMQILGDDHLKYYRIKEALEELPDAFYDRLARTVNKIPESRRTLGRIFGAALVRHPQLIPIAARFFV